MKTKDWIARYLSGCPSALAQLCLAMLEPQPSYVAGAPIRSLERILAGISEFFYETSTGFRRTYSKIGIMIRSFNKLLNHA